MEPEILKQGKIFHKRVQHDWDRTIKDGNLNIEHFIKLSLCEKKIKHKTSGRLDIFIDELGDIVSVIEIKSTNWDMIKEKNIKRLLGSHQRQVWNYIDEYLKLKKISVCPGIIYPKSPTKPGLKNLIENYLNEYGLQVVWFDK